MNIRRPIFTPSSRHVGTRTVYGGTQGLRQVAVPAHPYQRAQLDRPQRHLARQGPRRQGRVRQEPVRFSWSPMCRDALLTGGIWCCGSGMGLGGVV